MQDAEPLLQKVAPLPIPPFLLNDKFYDTLAENPSLDRNDSQPLRMSYNLPGYHINNANERRTHYSIMDFREETPKW